MSKKTNWKTTDNRFVAFIDILGFKDKVMRKPHNEIYEELSKISKVKSEIIETAEQLEKDVLFFNADIYIVNFSDSIVLFSKNDDLDNFQFFLTAVRYLFSNALNESIPLKGGIAHGEISINKSEQIYFGQPIIDAYIIEEDVNYFGIVAHNSIDKYIAENKFSEEENKRIEQLMFRYKTPLKSGKINHLNIDWFAMCSNTKDPKLLDKIRECILSFNTSVSGSPRKYVDNTLDLFNELNENKKVNLLEII